jgi:DNA modification methylase
MLVASQLGRRSVGIDLAEEYLLLARERAAAH